jgi:hypothetical protein
MKKESFRYKFALALETITSVHHYDGIKQIVERNLQQRGLGFRFRKILATRDSIQQDEKGEVALLVFHGTIGFPDRASNISEGGGHLEKAFSG